MKTEDHMIDERKLLEKIHADYMKRQKGKAPLTQQKIADAIGVSMLYLNRIFRRLKSGEEIPPMRALTLRAVQKYVASLK
jgi:transcriptional regulator with XRE-family HTH domain